MAYESFRTAGGGSVAVETDDVQAVTAGAGGVVTLQLAGSYVEVADGRPDEVFDKLGEGDPGWSLYKTAGAANVTMIGESQELPQSAADAIKLHKGTLPGEGWWHVAVSGGGTFNLVRGSAPAFTLEARAPGGRWGPQTASLTGRTTALEIRPTS